MKERPIIFSGPMVLAILEGRKTQTRRVVKLTDGTTHCAAGMAKLRGSHATPLRDGIGLVWRPVGGSDEVPMPPEKVADLCPYGQPGDRLWVRERQRVLQVKHGRDHTDEGTCEIQVKYEADGATTWIEYPDRLKASPVVGKCLSYGGFRESSRITLEVVSVRVERLQSISGPDCIAEGIAKRWRLGDGPSPGGDIWADTRNDYRMLWEKINGKGSWAANPWVWVVEFKRIEVK